MIYPFSAHLYEEEAHSVDRLLTALDWPEERALAIEADAVQLVEAIRVRKGGGGELEAFLSQYALDTDEGLAMMALAEALLRIPDTYTAGELIRDKVAAANWLEKQGRSKDWLSKAAGLGMKLTAKTLDSALSRLGEPLIREAMIRAMQMMGRQFVMGTDIAEAARHARALEGKGYRMSYDVLGEGARDAETAQCYFKAYQGAIEELAKNIQNKDRVSGVSVKLSALHPRYEYAQKERCVPVVAEKLAALARLAAKHNMPLTVDAEEAARLDLSITIFEEVLKDPALEGWEGFGLAVQAYQKRALPLIDYLAQLAQAHGRKIHIRLVKGAYWDTEIKLAQVSGHPGFPVFTRKCNTDLSWLACAQKLLEYAEVIYPMFATHNAHSVAAILGMTKSKDARFEFQRLHGMGEGLYDAVLAKHKAEVSVYAPVGPHRDLLPYLVRRLLENGANSSFVNKLFDDSVSPAEIVRDPVRESRENEQKSHPYIALPNDIFGIERPNSHGQDLNDPQTSGKTLGTIQRLDTNLSARSLVDGKEFKTLAPPEKYINRCFASSKAAFSAWESKDVHRRANIIEHFAELLEAHRDELMAICVHEGGKTIADSRDEVREAVDFCHYYAARARESFSAQGLKMPGYTGESNVLSLHGRGVFVAISPWNFPLAIFIGQVVAALLAGNCVLAKPASQTRFVAMRCVQLLHLAGVPGDVLHLLLGNGAFGEQMVAHPGVAGVVFTGSTAVAKSIQRTLADKNGPIVPLIAETGGQNAMIVDSSCLPEQVVDDVILSAFGSAGQRCSALRVLYVQEEIADSFIHLLKGAMQELVVGDPKALSTDVGPVIDAPARNALKAHQDYLKTAGTLIAQVPIPKILSNNDRYFAPLAYEISRLDILKEEVFGPILHVIRYRTEDMDNVIDQINTTGYGLTFGLHSRIQSRQAYVAGRVNAGNIYVNRSMTGAVVGVQPFGGMGLSGTGPKAGGPHYLHAFATEKHISINTTAAGGNASLVSMTDKNPKS